MVGIIKPRCRDAIRITAIEGRTISWSRTTDLKGTIKQRWKASNSQLLTKYNKTHRDVVQRETWTGASICLLWMSYNKDSETANGDHSKTEVIECYMQGPENIKWSVRVNETKIAGVKSTTTGNQLELVIHIDLKTETKE